MAKSIYLHIGTNKTGTSAIQHFMNQHREVLKSQGLLYPVTGCQGEAHYGISAVLGFAQGSHKLGVVRKAAFVQMQDALQTEFAESEAQHLVISSENFIMPAAVEPVAAFFKPYEVRVVVYLRRHDHWWQSAHNQAVKMVANPPWGRTLQAFVNFHKRKKPTYGDYRFLIDRWAAVFGKKNILVRPYEREQNQPDIVSDFFQTIGLAAVGNQIAERPGRVNESLSFDALNLMDIYQRADVNPELRAHLLQHARTLSVDRGCVHFVSPTFCRDLIESNQADYAYIAREYLGRKDGRLFYEPLPEPDDSWKPPAPLTYMAVVEETIKALADHNVVLNSSGEPA